MQGIEEAIRLAILKGGWLSEKLYGGDYPYAPHGITNIEVHYGRIFMNRMTQLGKSGRRFQHWTTKDAVLDRLFWKSLERALRWSNITINNGIAKRVETASQRIDQEEWRYHAHRYLDAHFKGQEAEDKFWKELK